MPQKEHVREAGKANLPLVLLPGTLCDERVFGPLRERLAGIATKVMVMTEAWTMREAAEQVLAAAPEQFALLGFSLGGMVAMETALCAPERVCGLALLSTSPLPVEPEQHVGRRAAVAKARHVGVSRFLRERMWAGYRGAAESNEILSLLEAMAERVGHEVFARQTEMALSREDYCSRLHTVRCPTLVLAGNADRVCPPAAQKALTAALAECVEVVLPGAGHLALLEKPDEVSAAVAAWFHTAELRKRPDTSAIG